MLAKEVVTEEAVQFAFELYGKRPSPNSRRGCARCGKDNKHSRQVYFVRVGPEAAAQITTLFPRMRFEDTPDEILEELRGREGVYPEPKLLQVGSCYGCDSEVKMFFGKLGASGTVSIQDLMSSFSMSPLTEEG